MTAKAPEAAVETFELDAVQILDDVVRRAFSLGASDIHLEPKRDRMHIRFRIDGNMVEQGQVAHELAPQLVSRVKVLARMDIAERRLPQDGQFTLENVGARVHLRASTFPCSQGEKVVLRILLGHTLIAFDRLGMDERTRERVRACVVQPQGFIVTAGPTGAGKTSTLYSFLQLLDTSTLNVVTLEDPIEVELLTITQGQTNVRAGFTFAAGLRAILRQDPDVILVGEMRDAETAGIALQAALTGHLVMSTLHTSDCVETIVRLVDLGIEPWIIASSLSAVIAQRLVRVVCKSCIETRPLEQDFWEGDEILMMAGTPTLHAKGCRACNMTGYRGRTGIFEVLEVDDVVRDLIKAKAPVTAFRELMTQRHIPTLRRAGMVRVAEGVTTVAEVGRVT
jgi:general secretion pathway protein E/type IV pilus assembly protein PilB